MLSQLAAGKRGWGKFFKEKERGAVSRAAAAATGWNGDPS